MRAVPGTRSLHEDPRGGGGYLGPWSAPANPGPLPTSEGVSSGKTMKFITGAGNVRPILGTKTYLGL